MGWFDSDIEISVFSDAVPLADPDTNLMAETILRGLLTNQDINEGIKHLAFNGVAYHVRRMMKYAKEHYTLGLPEGVNAITTILDPDDVKAAITADMSLTYGCEIDYGYVAPLTAFHIVLPFLEKQRGYNIITEYINTFPDGIEYPDIPQSGAYGEIHNLTVTGAQVNSTTDLSTTDVTITIEYNLATSYRTTQWSYDDDGQRIGDHTYYTINTDQTEDIVVTRGVTGYLLGQPFCIAKYYELDSEGAPAETADYWIYDITSGKYPNLNEDITLDDSDNLFPIVPLRYHNVSYTDEAHEETELYITSKKLLKKIGIDIEYLNEKIEEHESIGDIDHCYFMFGINMQTERNESIRYLTEFFDYLYDSIMASQTETTAALTDGTSVSVNGYSFINPAGTSEQTTYRHVSYGDDEYYEQYSVTVNNNNTPISLVEHGLNVGIQYTFISSTLVPGSIGDVGTATMTKTKKPVQQFGFNKSAYKNTKHPHNQSEVTFKLQIGENVYKKVTVLGLRHYNNVYQGHTVWTTIDQIVDDPENHNFVIPLHYGVAKGIPPLQRNQLYLESMHMIVQGIIETEVKWYEKGIFKYISYIIAIVLTIFTANPMFLIALFVGVAIQVLSQYLPPEMMRIIQFIYIVYAAYSLDWSGMLNGLADAATYLTAVNLAISAIKLPMQIRMENLQGEMEGLSAAHEARMTELAKLTEELDTSSDLDPGIFMDGDRFVPMFMEPADFYRLKLNTQPGTLVLDGPKYFVSNQLELPDNAFQV